MSYVVNLGAGRRVGGVWRFGELLSFLCFVRWGVVVKSLRLQRQFQTFLTSSRGPVSTTDYNKSPSPSPIRYALINPTSNYSFWFSASPLYDFLVQCLSAIRTISPRVHQLNYSNSSILEVKSLNSTLKLKHLAPTDLFSTVGPPLSYNFHPEVS